MKGIILLNGEPYSGRIDDRDALVYCCDGAYNWAKGRVRIDKNLGDFDSVSAPPYPPPDEVYPSEKDYTDGELALEKILDAGVDEVEFYGFGGGREDHFIGNLQLLYRAIKRGVSCAAYTDNAIIFPAEGTIDFGKFVGRTVSVLPFGGRLHIINYKGLKYAYPESLSYGECRGISNVVESENAHLTVKGTALIFINRGVV